MPQNRNSFGRDLPRAAMNVLDGWVRDLQVGRLPPETVPTKGGNETRLTVTVDGESMTVRAFLDACREAEPEKVDAVLHGLDRREAVVDPSRPYSVPGLTTPFEGAGLVNLLAGRLKHGGPVPVRVSALGDRVGKGESVRDALLGMRDDRGERAKPARVLLDLGDMPDGKVAAIVLDRLERAGVLVRPHEAGDDRAAVEARMMAAQRAQHA